MRELSTLQKNLRNFRKTKVQFRHATVTPNSAAPKLRPRTINVKRQRQQRQNLEKHFNRHKIKRITLRQLINSKITANKPVVHFDSAQQDSTNVFDKSIQELQERLQLNLLQQAHILKQQHQQHQQENQDENTFNAAAASRLDATTAIKVEVENYQLAAIARSSPATAKSAAAATSVNVSHILQPTQIKTEILEVEASLYIKNETNYPDSPNSITSNISDNNDNNNNNEKNNIRDTTQFKFDLSSDCRRTSSENNYFLYEKTENFREFATTTTTKSQQLRNRYHYEHQQQLQHFLTESQQQQNYILKENLSTMQLQHHLSIQQQELLQQLQMVQRQYLIQQGFVKPLQLDFQTQIHRVLSPTGSQQFGNNVLVAHEQQQQHQMQQRSRLSDDENFERFQNYQLQHQQQHQFQQQQQASLQQQHINHLKNHSEGEQQQLHQRQLQQQQEMFYDKQQQQNTNNNNYYNLEEIESKQQIKIQHLKEEHQQQSAISPLADTRQHCNSNGSNDDNESNCIKDSKKKKITNEFITMGQTPQQHVLPDEDVHMIATSIQNQESCSRRQLSPSSATTAVTTVADNQEDEQEHSEPIDNNFQEWSTTTQHHNGSNITNNNNSSRKNNNIADHTNVKINLAYLQNTSNNNTNSIGDSGAFSNKHYTSNTPTTSALASPLAATHPKVIASSSNQQRPVPVDATQNAVYQASTVASISMPPKTLAASSTQPSPEVDLPALPATFHHHHPTHHQQPTVSAAVAVAAAAAAVTGGGCADLLDAIVTDGGGKAKTRSSRDPNNTNNNIDHSNNINAVRSLPPSVDLLMDDFNSRKYYHPLYAHGVCRWPGCELSLEDVNAFVNHLNVEHSLDDRSTAQARVQMQVVSQLEIHLQKERDRLQAMMHHLYLTKQFLSPDKGECKESADDQYHNIGPPGDCTPPSMTSTNLNLNLNNSQPITINSPILNSANISAIRKRISDKSPLSLAGGLPYMLERAGLDVQQESPDKQLTLNEIYNWFQNTFCYFRRNAATWKNAIRTNLSLHKCFVRYEDDFGSFWMVDDSEFVKRRHLSRGRPRKYEPPTSASPPTTAAPVPTTADGSGSVFNSVAAASVTVCNGDGTGGSGFQSGNKSKNHHKKSAVTGGDNLEINIPPPLLGRDNDNIGVVVGLAGFAGHGPPGQGSSTSSSAAHGGHGGVDGYFSCNFQSQNHRTHESISNSPTYCNNSGGNFSPNLQNIWTCAPSSLEEAAALSLNSHLIRHNYESYRNFATGIHLQTRSPNNEIRVMPHQHHPYQQQQHQQHHHLHQQQQHLATSNNSLAAAAFMSSNEKLFLCNLERRCRSVALKFEQQQHSNHHQHHHQQQQHQQQLLHHHRLHTADELDEEAEMYEQHAEETEDIKKTYLLLKSTNPENLTRLTSKSTTTTKKNEHDNEKCDNGDDDDADDEEDDIADDNIQTKTYLTVQQHTSAAADDDDDENVAATAEEKKNC